MSVPNPFGGVPPNQARGLQLTNGKVARSVLKLNNTIGLDQRLGRQIRKTPTRIPLKPIGVVLKPKRAFSKVKPLLGAQTRVTTVHAGVGSHIPTKVW